MVAFLALTPTALQDGFNTRVTLTKDQAMNLIAPPFLWSNLRLLTRLNTAFGVVHNTLHARPSLSNTQLVLPRNHLVRFAREDPSLLYSLPPTAYAA